MKYAVFILVFTVGLASCKDEPEVKDAASLRLTLTHKVANELLELNTARYDNALGQSYNITKFRYYLSNIRLRNTRTGGVYIAPESYHLVGTENGNVFEIMLADLPIGEYNQLEFAIGVDNSTNTSTDRLGALDPSNDMAWDWNTGYKFISLEGNYYLGAADLIPLVFHIGSDDNYRIKTYTLGQDDTTVLDMKANVETKVAIDVHIDKLFSTPNVVDFDTHSVVMFDPYAQNIADNYAGDMFEITSIE